MRVRVRVRLALTLTLTPNQVHDVWGGTARASEPLRVVPVKLDTALVGSASLAKLTPNPGWG